MRAAMTKVVWVVQEIYLKSLHNEDLYGFVDGCDPMSLSVYVNFVPVTCNVYALGGLRSIMRIKIAYRMTEKIV